MDPQTAGNNKTDERQSSPKMGSSVFKFTRGHMLALALGLGLAGSLATAPASFAASTQQPTIGAACQPDGKINGGGSTFQTNAINNAFTYGYQNDICGAQPSVSGLFAGGTFNGLTFPAVTSDPSQFTFNSGASSVQGMVAYNPTNATNGSGAGLKRLSCRTDMFAGTDLPYNTTQIGQINGAPGSESGGSAPNYGCLTQSNINTQTVPPAYGPQAYGTWPNPTGETDTSSKAMAFPVAGGAVAFVANLENTSPSSTVGGCTTTPAAGQQLDLTPTETDDIWQGTINQWNDSTLEANNSFLASDGCSGPIQRVVREDNSGTTAITQFTLNGYDKGTIDSAAGCGAGPNTTVLSTYAWYYAAIASSNWGYWPRGCEAANTGNTVAPNEVWSGETNTNTEGGNSGSPNLISLVESTTGGFTGNGGYGSIGYAELGLWGAAPSTTGGLVEAALATPATQTSATPTYALPGNAGASSTCSIPATVPTGGSAASAVGLGTTTWTNTGTPAAPGKQDIADPSGGTGYPACGLTFDLVYTHQNESNEVAAPSGSSITATPGCTITAPAAVTTTVDNLSGSTTLVSPTTGFPASGTISAAGQTLTYTSLSGGFVLSAATSTDIPSGSSVTLLATSAAATATTPGINGVCQTYDDSVSGMTNDQLRTVYSYFSYMFSPLGMDETNEGATNGNLQAQTLDPLPAAWLPTLEEGFQQNL
jgi:ABC-type phosphate transport system substrate-binding protein